MAVEKAVGIDITAEEAEKFVTVADVVNYVEENRA